MSHDMYNQSTFLVVKTAYLYYIAEMPQSDIAAELNISITTVSRLLKRAKSEKIIEFVIRDPYVKCLRLESELRKQFGLKDVIIAPAFSGDHESDHHPDPQNVKKLVALEAARYLQRIIKEDDILGITWGSTVYYMINYLNPAQKVDATFVTLHGSLTCCVNDWDVRTLVTRIAKAFSGRNYSLPTETLMSSRKIADMLKKEKNIARVYDMFDKINISITGIGSMYPEMTSVLATPDYLSAEEVALLKEKGVVGDIALHFIDKDGRECQTDLIDRTISMDFEKYKKIDTKITIASDVSKAYTLLSALKGGLIDVLIIDNQLGEEILRLHQLGADAYSQ